MKTRRIASSIALAAAIALGATGCGLIAPQGTLHQYAPSDGIDVTLENVAVRNLLLIADENGENFNVVFTAVNNNDAPLQLRLAFEGGTTADFVVEPGVNVFGSFDGEVPPTIVQLKGVAAGDTVNAVIASSGGEEEREIPVLDGTLAEYKSLVPTTERVETLEADEAEAAAEAAQ